MNDDPTSLRASIDGIRLSVSQNNLRQWLNQQGYDAAKSAEITSRRNGEREQFKGTAFEARIA